SPERDHGETSRGVEHTSIFTQQPGIAFSTTRANDRSRKGSATCDRRLDESNLILPRVDLPLFVPFCASKNIGFHCVWTAAYPLPMTGAVMNLKLFLWLLTAILLAFFHRAEAQQPEKIRWIGYLTASGSLPNQAFVQALRDLGYVEGK